METLPLKKRPLREEPIDLTYKPCASGSCCSSAQSSSSPGLSSVTPPNEFPCHLCNAVFPSQQRLRAHARRHIIKSSGRHTCKTCNKTFVQQSSLKTHERIHTGEKPYLCLTCNNAYGDLSTFTKHLRTHTGEKPFNCEICKRRFSQSGNCLRHKRSVHGIGQVF